MQSYNFFSKMAQVNFFLNKKIEMKEGIDVESQPFLFHSLGRVIGAAHGA